MLLVAGVSLLAGCATDRGAGAGVDARELVKSSRSWDGAMLPPYPQGQPEVSIKRIIIPAGVRLELHRHPVINAGVLLRGQLTVVTDDGRTLHLKEGDPIVELVGTAHYGVNEGAGPAEIVVFYAGVSGASVTVPVAH